MGDLNGLSSNELGASVDSTMYYDSDYEDQVPGQLGMYDTQDYFIDRQPGMDDPPNDYYIDQPAEDYEDRQDNDNTDYEGARAEPKTVDPEDAILIIVENFHTLKSGVPDANNRHLWELANDCLKKEDSAAEYVLDLISTGDYPLEEEGSVNFYEQREWDDDFNAAMKYCSLRSILPKADTAYLWDIAKDHSDSQDDVFNQFVIHLQESGDYPTSDLYALSPVQRTELKKREMYKNAQEILHTIDSLHIEEQLNTDPTIGYNEEGVGQLILKFMEDTKLHPSKSEEYYRKVTQEAIEEYSDNFDIEKFLQKFPEPVLYFESPSTPGGPKYRADLYKYLRSVVEPNVTNERIRQIQKQYVSLIKCHRNFFGYTVPLRTIEYKLTDECGRFINELTYIRFYEVILPTAAIYASLLDERDDSANNDLYEDEAVKCELCDELTPLQKALTCTEAHVFCAECVRGWVNERLGQGSVVVNCMQTCSGTMHDTVLKRVLPKGALDKVIKRRQEQDVGAAHIDGMQNCLWCDYSYVPRNEDMDLVCLSPDCGERWCRKCRQLAHHPAPCEDTPEEVKKRVYIEERMTNAMVKQCPRCSVDIVKIDGCDFVTCKCGVNLCYNCGRESPGYHHCQQPRRIQSVQTEGQKAKEEAERLFPNVSLNYDPTRLP